METYYLFSILVRFHSSYHVTLVLVEHVYLASSPAAESERTMLFYCDARVDGLTKREEKPLSMTEHFAKREDFLFYKHVEFGQKPKRAGPKGEDSNPRPILVCNRMILLLFTQTGSCQLHNFNCFHTKAYLSS